MSSNLTLIPIEEATKNLPGGQHTNLLLLALSTDGKTVTLNQMGIVEAVYREGFNDALSPVQNAGIVRLANAIRGGSTDDHKSNALQLDIQKMGWVKPAIQKA